MANHRRRLIRVLGNTGQNVYRTTTGNRSSEVEVYVYPTGKDPHQAHTDMPSVALTVHPDGRWEVSTREAWTPGQDRAGYVTVAVGHADRPAVAGPGGWYPTEPVFTWKSPDGDDRSGIVEDLVRMAVNDAYGFAEEPTPAWVYVPLTGGARVQVPVTVDRSPYVEGWADLTVAVTLPNGQVATAYERLNGDV